MTDQSLIYAERDNKENLLDNQVKKKNQFYMSPINMKPQSQNNSTPDQAYNSKDLANKSQNINFQAINYTPQDINDPTLQSLFPPSQNSIIFAKIL